jgi:Family of unknown function (DUF6294)
MTIDTKHSLQPTALWVLVALASLSLAWGAAAAEGATAAGSPKNFAVQLSDNTREIQPGNVQETDFFWNDPIFVGHCRLAVSSLSVFSDGTAHWRSNQVSSTSIGDVWVASFEFFDNHNISLWKFGTIPSPVLSPTSVVWTNDTSMVYPAYMFPSVARVVLYSSC